MAGSMDRCETFTVNCPGPGSGTGSLVSSQSVARGSPDGRAASRTWWLVGNSVLAGTMLAGTGRLLGLGLLIGW